MPGDPGEMASPEEVVASLLVAAARWVEGARISLPRQLVS